MKKTIYLAGAVSGHNPNHVRVKFAVAQQKLEEQGHEVLNPVEEVALYNEALDRSGLLRLASWQEEMRVCIAWMMNCEKLALLPDWQSSKGACLERDIAARLGMEIIYL